MGWFSWLTTTRVPASIISPIPDPPKPTLPLGHITLAYLGQKIKHVMLAKKYTWFEAQNVVTVEKMNPDGTPCTMGPNSFDDIKMVLDGTGKIIGGPWEATSHPGEFWTKHPMAGTAGAFIIAEGQQLGVWVLGPYDGLTVWRQAPDSTIMGHRDPKATYQRQGAPIKYGDIGVHHHGGGNAVRTNIARRAAGCQVIRRIQDQAAFMALTRKDPLYLKDLHGFRLTATVLEYKDLFPS